MSGCCTPRFYGKVFSEKTARRDARRYRERGLRGTALVTFEWLRARRPETVLEIGGGVGALDVELLLAGAARATNVELSPSYAAAAGELAREAGVGDRLVFRAGDVLADGVEPADAVVLHRVLCCYPGGEELLGAASRAARRHLVFTVPRDTWWTRAGSAAANVLLWALRLRFRTYVHSVSALVGVAEASGLRRAHDEHGTVWRTIAFER
jgi:SAM-dependent methyltransferase